MAKNQKDHYLSQAQGLVDKTISNVTEILNTNKPQKTNIINLITKKLELAKKNFEQKEIKKNPDRLYSDFLDKKNT